LKELAVIPVAALRSCPILPARSVVVFGWVRWRRRRLAAPSAGCASALHLTAVAGTSLTRKTEAGPAGVVGVPGWGHDL